MYSDYPGKLIVIDGTDGSGKTTQLNLLKEKLEATGYSVKTADFPQYNQKSAGMVEEYLSGKYGSADDVSPYQASLFYAVDRFDASFQIKQWLLEGKIVLANRYVSSNMAHQGGKIDNPLERKVFLNWLLELEYDLLKIPRPDACLILKVEAEISQRLSQERNREDWTGKTKDIHEENLDHLKKAEQVYIEIADSSPDCRLINCTNSGQMLGVEEIQFLIWIHVSQLIKNIPKAPATPGFTGIADILAQNHRQAAAMINQQKEIAIQKPFITIDPANEIAAAPVFPEISEAKENQITTQTTDPQLEKNKILRFEKISPEAILPKKNHADDAGLDLFALDYESIPPYSQSAVGTGIKMAIPQGNCGLIWGRSSLGKEGIAVLGGVIDAGYRGEVKVIIKNLSEEFFHIIPGQKIAQIIIQPVSECEIREEAVNNETARGSQGFGSSGKF